MLGTSHAATGMIVGLVSLPIATPGAPAWVQAGWVVVCGGAAVLPDLDHPESLVSRMWGPVSATLSVFVARLARGHRAGTHDAVMAPVLIVAVTWLASWWQPAFAVVVALTIGLVLRVTLLRRGGLIGWLTNLTASAVFGWSLSLHPVMIAAGHTLLPAALAAGVWAHQLGDLLTPEGLPVPIIWLANPQRRVAIGLFTTGHLIERVVVGPMLGVAVLVLGWWRAGIHNPAQMAGLLHDWPPATPPKLSSPLQAGFAAL